MVSDRLQEAIAAIESGDPMIAQRLLVEILRSDSRNTDAWLWLAKVCEPERRRQCLERVLMIHPNHEEAQEALAALDLEELFQPAEPPPAPEPAPTPLPEPQPPSKPVSATPSKTSASRPKRTSHRWEHPFKIESDVMKQFVEYVDELIDVAESVDAKPTNEIGSLRYAKKKHEQSTGGSQGSTNIFLAPAVRAAATIAETLLSAERYPKAFWAANSFAEPVFDTIM